MTSHRYEIEEKTLQPILVGGIRTKGQFLIEE